MNQQAQRSGTTLGDYAPMLRVSRNRPCPVCGRGDWCLAAEDESACLCQRVQEGSRKRVGDAGWLHILRDDEKPVTRPRRRVAVIRPGEPAVDLGPLAASCGAAVNPEELQDLAESLGLTVEGLTRLRVGWAADHRAWAFPMHGPDGRIRGIRLRTWAGRKFSVTGGREGLFLPVGLTWRVGLLVPEGPTDTAALLDLGFEAVGRPSCNGGVRLLCDLVKRTRPPEVIVFADNDEPKGRPDGSTWQPGQAGAEALASALRVYAPRVRVIAPPTGIKDARAWLQAGATREDVQGVIDAATVRTVTVTREERQ